MVVSFKFLSNNSINIYNTNVIIYNTNDDVVFNGQTSNLGLIKVNLKKYHVYRISIKNNCIPVYINQNKYVIPLYLNKKYTIKLTDMYYTNLPIEKGKIILNSP